jgi:hypothetical protein
LQTHRLVSHPAFVPGSIKGVAVRWGHVGDGRIMLRYRIDGCGDLAVPGKAESARAEDLWQTTCCEMFLAGADGCYREFNFSPSGQWAAYAFAGYRTNRSDFDPLRAPEIAIDSGPSVFTLTVFLDEAELAQVHRVAFCSVLEENKGRLSYWAAQHPGLRPDFHNPACFVLPVAPAGVA